MADQDASKGTPQPSAAPTLTTPTLPLSKIKAWDEIDSRFFKEDAESLAAFAATVKADKGIKSPVLVNKGEDGSYRLIDGRRRFRAAKINGYADIPVNVISISEDEARDLSLRLNVEREQLSGMEIYLNIAELAKRKDWKTDDKGFSDKVARYFGMSRAWVTQHLKLGKVPENLRKKVHEGLIDKKAVIGLSNLPPELLADIVGEAEKAAAARAESKAKKAPKKRIKPGKPGPVNPDLPKPPKPGKKKPTVTAADMRAATATVAASSPAKAQAIAAAGAVKLDRTIIEFEAVLMTYFEDPDSKHSMREFAAIFRKWRKLQIDDAEFGSQAIEFFV